MTDDWPALKAAETSYHLSRKCSNTDHAGKGVQRVAASVLVITLTAIAIAVAVIVIAPSFVTRGTGRHGPRRFHAGLDLPGDPGVPDDPDELLSVLRPCGAAVENKLNRVLRARRALLRRREETR